MNVRILFRAQTQIRVKCIGKKVGKEMLVYIWCTIIVYERSS